MVLIIRNSAYSIFFYMWTILLCFLILPTIFLPRIIFIKITFFYFYGCFWGEKIFLNLDLQIYGLENLPRDTPYIIAAKHQSVHETLKLPLLFQDPAIILKKELTQIPFWGWYVRKAGMIAIDRQSRERAKQTLLDGSRKAIEENRPIVIFPQGTRVPCESNSDRYPYKGGIGKLYEAFPEIPIYPMAINSGVFWAKGKFLKKSGVATFKVMPAIQKGLSYKEFMKQLENSLEEESKILVRKVSPHL